MRTLLIGNGFSRGYDDDLFGYKALFEDARLTTRIDRIFDRFGTTDFEVVMRRMDEAVDLLTEYRGSSGLRSSIQDDRAVVRTALISAIQDHHPVGGHILTSTEIDRCERFLKSFDQIFTTNYDLLLYWVILDRLRSQFTDGFRGSPVVWSRDNSQSVYYLHGALHLWDDGSSVRKITFSNHTIGEQVADRIDAGRYPLFVSEGSSKQKLRSIRSNPYLSNALGALASISGELVVYGFSFSQQDSHIANSIVKSSASDVLITYHRNRESVVVNDFKDRCRSIKRRMDAVRTNPVSLRFKESASVFSWR